MKIPYDDIEVLWSFMRFNEAPRSADAMIVLGNVDDRVASYAAAVANSFAYDLVVFTGGSVARNPRLASWSASSEAEHFAAIFKKQTNRDFNVLLETRAQNTGQNAQFSLKLISASGLSIPRSVQLVTRSYMERRALGTFQAQWPDRLTQFYITSEHASFREYCSQDYPETETASKLHKDFTNMKVYAQRGWQSPVVVPDHVEAAAKKLDQWLNNLI